MRETRAPRIAPRARFWFAFYAFLADFQGGPRTRWPERLAYNSGGLHSILLPNPMVAVAAHTPCLYSCVWESGVYNPL